MNEPNTSTMVTSSEADLMLKINPAQQESKERLKFLRSGVIVGFITEVLFLATGDIASGNKLTITVDVALLSSFLFVYISSFYSKKFKLMYNIAIFAVGMATIIAFYGASGSRSIFLTPVTVLIAYLLLGKMGGVIWTVIFCASIFMAHVLDKLEIVSMQLDTKQLIFGLISTALISILMYVYASIAEINERIVAQRDVELLDLNTKLSQQLRENKTTARELTSALESAQKNNQMLKDTKSAIMNILDDTNELQAQLKTEKADIEQTVLERTEQLREEQARLTASINSVGSGLLMTFTDNKAVIHNPALEELLGITDHACADNKKTLSHCVDIIQSRLGNLFDLQKAIQDSQNNSKPFLADNIEIDDKFITIKGSPIILKGQKQPIGCIVLMDDKTEAIMLERSKDEFISIASHELRTPLTAIRGNADMIETMYGDKMPDEDSRTMISDIKDSSVRLISIVNQFLTTSRLEQKHTVFDKKPIDIAKNITYSTDQLKGLLDEKKLQLVINVPDNLPLVLADETRVQEVIVNLAGNAIKYTDSGTITISARVVDGFVQVDFSDTGKGIEPKNQVLLFHKFQQASTDILTREDSRSTGLGLYITKLLVEQMGGSIYLSKSEPGQGSTFTFTLPIADAK